MISFFHLGGGSGLSDILSSLGNRGSGGGSGGGSGLTDIIFGRGGSSQPQPQQPPSSGSSQTGGFLSGLSSIFGKIIFSNIMHMFSQRFI